MSEYVRKAQDWALRLISEEFETVGNTDIAMRRVARKHHVPYRALWSLRYRAPREIGASVYFALQAAYEATHAAHARQAQHELAIQQAKGRAHSPLVRAAAALLGQGDCDA
jgi:hypothetical protein